MNFKKITAAVSAVVLSAGLVSALPSENSAMIKASAATASAHNYAEALQKSMFFYEVQQSGVLPDWNTVQWRDNSMVDEDGNETDFVKGGWFDAGDHFKFTLTNAYSASIMAWGYLEYKDAVDKAGLGELYRNNLKWGLDYVLGCDMGNGKMVGTIGDFEGGSTDHNIWCSAEVYLRKHNLNNGDWERPYDIIENSTVSALSAAALAQGYMIFKDSDPTTANNYLKHAKSLFQGADTIRDTMERGGMGSMYPTSTWVDDCMYAALWLYKATGDSTYLTKVENDYIPKFPTESQSTNWKYSWGLCWDDTTQAAALLYAQITGKQEWVNHIDKHIRYWMGEGGTGSDIKSFEGRITDDGLSHLTNWGSLRHASNTAWLAKLASDTLFKNDSAKAQKYNSWADSQINYCLGDNALGLTYVLGMGEKNPVAIHHRSASGIHDDHWNELGKEDGGAEGWQTEYAHTLYGALIGGPDNTGAYDIGKIGVGQYEYTEVAIDYNAGYTAALCALVADNGGKADASFPQTETPKWAEWEVAAVLNGKGNSYTEIKAWAMNHTAWPARVAKDIEYRYYFDASEIFDAGLTINDITVKSNSQQYQQGQQGYATVSGPFVYEGDKSGNTLYASIKFEDGRAIQPTGQSEHRDEVQFRVSIPDAINGKPTTGAWDPTNDWSYKGGIATATNIKSDDALNENMPMYVNGVLVWGTEPDGTKPTKSDYTFTRGGGTTNPDPDQAENPSLTYSKGDGKVQLKWNAVSGIEGYGIYGEVNGTWKLIGKAGKNATSYVVTGLKAGTNYKVAVCVYQNGKWNTDTSKAITVTPNASTGATAPTLKVSTTATQFKAEWTKVSGATAYAIGWSKNGTSGWSQITAFNTSTFSWVSPSAKTPKGTYYLAVAAKVNGAWKKSNVVKVTITG